MQDRKNKEEPSRAQFRVSPEGGVGIKNNELINNGSIEPWFVHRKTEASSEKRKEEQQRPRLEKARKIG